MPDCLGREKMRIQRIVPTSRSTMQWLRRVRAAAASRALIYALHRERVRR
jgi:hypothetical protein